jgi:hypothetical protein
MHKRTEEVGRRVEHSLPALLNGILKMNHRHHTGKAHIPHTTGKNLLCQSPVTYCGVENATRERSRESELIVYYSFPFSS